MGGGLGTQLSLVQGLPLTAGSQYVEDGVGTAAIRHTRTTAAKAMAVHPFGQQGFQHRPQVIRDTESGCGAVIGRSRPVTFRRLCTHALQYIRYSDRLLVSIRKPV